MIIGSEYLEKLKRMLMQQEGLRLDAYPDPISGDKPWTIGYGHTGSDICKGKTISKFDALDYLEKDIFNAEKDLVKNIKIYPSINDARKLVLLDMCFNLGITRLLHFKNMLYCLSQEDYIGTAKEILDSNAAKQLPDRYKLLANIMEEGEI